jgi:hypothetical protein
MATSDMFPAGVGINVSVLFNRGICVVLRL